MTDYLLVRIELKIQHRFITVRTLLRISRMQLVKLEELYYLRIIIMVLTVIKVRMLKNLRCRKTITSFKSKAETII
jgi:hypothetical protein